MGAIFRFTREKGEENHFHLCEWSKRIEKE
jgi:hypothetical protein